MESITLGKWSGLRATAQLILTLGVRLFGLAAAECRSSADCLVRSQTFCAMNGAGEIVGYAGDSKSTAVWNGLAEACKHFRPFRVEQGAAATANSNCSIAVAAAL